MRCFGMSRNRPKAGLVSWLTAMHTRNTGKTGCLSVATALFGMGLVLVPPCVNAQSSNERYIAMLPEVCRYKLARMEGRPYGNPAEAARYQALLGPMDTHIHHYCYGLIITYEVKLSRRMTPQARNHALGQSIVEFDYVISRAPADFILLPEILTKRGESLLALRRVQDAHSTLSRAIETKPDYWPAYAVLSDYYKASGELDKAREWLDKGLGASPSAKALEARRVELKRMQ
jgi:tetratricopeptide (TPR) repeat protein